MGVFRYCKPKDERMSKERQLLLKGPLVLKTIKGLKTETRRVIALKQLRGFDLEDVGHAARVLRKNPYGQVGDKLYVRETWKHKTVDNYVDRTEARVVYKADEVGRTVVIRDRAQRDMTIKGIEHGSRWRPGIHMPQIYSRLRLKIRAVSIERLHEITESSAQAEGVESFAAMFPDMPEQRLTTGELAVDSPYRSGFAVLWDEINGDRGYLWKNNPYVFVVKYQVDECLVHT